MEKGKSGGRYSIRLSSSESHLSSTERGFVRQRFIGCTESLDSQSKVKVGGLKHCKGVRLYDGSPELASGLFPRILRGLRKDHRSATMIDGESDSLFLIKDYG